MNRLLLSQKSRRAFQTLCGVLFFNATLHAQPIPEMLYYDFNGTGVSVPNLASNPPVGTATATIMGGVTQGGAGVCGGALVGTGVSSTTDYLNTGFTTAMPSSWTISWWCQGISTNGTLYYIFGDAGAGSFRCFTNGVAGSTNWVLRGTGITDAFINGGATVTPHVCTYVYDGSVNIIYGYLDGVLVSTTAQAGALNINGAGPFKVMGYSSNVGAPAGGLMDDFRMYNRALSAAEVLELVSPSISSVQSVSACESYYWPADSMTYSTSGQYTTTIANPAGCDTLLTLDLTITGPSYGPVETATACDSYFWNGLTYTASGMYYDTLVGVNGCDSINTLDLTIDFSPSQIISVTACDNYSWAIDGNNYSSSGTYYYTSPGSAVPCDSMYTLLLTINQSSSSTISQTAIDSYTAPSGAVYTSSGTYTDVIPNAAGCDSTITINLIVEYTGIGEIAGVEYVVYPNPADDLIQIQGVEAIADLKAVYITSLSGARVLNVANPFKAITVGDLNAGTYILHIETGSGTSTVRFVKE